MFEYYTLLRLRYKIPVFPVVLYLAPGAGGLTREEYTEGLFGEDILRFRYRAIGLPDLLADDYREQSNPLAALSALMQPSQLGRLVQKYRSIQQALASPLDEARKALLVNLIEQYLPLNAEEEAEFAQILGQADTQEVKAMLTVYEERGIVKGKRDTLLRLLRRKFGDLPEAMLAQIQAIQTEPELDALFDQALDANTLEEMGLSDS